MKSRIRFTIISLTLLLIFSNCALNRLSKHDKMCQLQKGMDSWRNFRLDGLASFNLSGFSFYKNITITNNQDSLKIVLYESGIFGSSPKPFAMLTITDTVSLQLPFTIVVDNKTLNNLDHDQLLANLINQDDFDQIINERRLVKEKTIILFNDHYLISEILYEDSEFRLNIEYDLDDCPLIITGYNNKKLLFQIEIDKFSIYETINEEKT